MFQNIPYRLTYQVFPDNVTFGRVLLLSSPGRVVSQDPELCSGMCTYGHPAVFRAPASPTPSSRPSHPNPVHTLTGQDPHCTRFCSREAVSGSHNPSHPPFPSLLPSLCSLTAPMPAVRAPPGRAPGPWAHPSPHAGPASNVEPSTQGAHDKYLLNDQPNPPKCHGLFWPSPWCSGDKPIPSLSANHHYPTLTRGIITGLLT